MFCCVISGLIAPGVSWGLGRSEAKAGIERTSAKTVPAIVRDKFTNIYFFPQAYLNKDSATVLGGIGIHSSMLLEKRIGSPLPNVPE